MKLTERFYEMWGLTFEGGEERTYSIAEEVAQLEERVQELEGEIAYQEDSDHQQTISDARHAGCP